MDHVELVLTREYRNAQKKLCSDAAQAPHIDVGVVVMGAEKNFWGSVITRLDIGVDGVLKLTGGTKVDELEVCGVNLLKKDVFGLEIAMNDIRVDEKGKRMKDLNEKST